MASFAPSFYYGLMSDARVAVQESQHLDTAIEQQPDVLLTAVEQQPKPSASIYSSYLATGMAPPAYAYQKKAEASQDDASQKSPVEQLPADYFLRRPDLEGRSQESPAVVQSSAAPPAPAPKEYTESSYIGFRNDVLPAYSAQKGATFTPLEVQEVQAESLRPVPASTGSRLVQPVKTELPQQQQQPFPLPGARTSQLADYAAVQGDAFKPVMLSEYHFDQLNDLASYVDSKY